MEHPGWTLVVVGLLIALVGAVWARAPSIPWLGRLPGDISIEGEGFRFDFPLLTCVVLSLVPIGAVWLIRLFFR